MDDKSNEQFFEELCDKYYEKVFSFCRSFLGYNQQSVDIAEECTQQTFLEAGKNIDNLKVHPNVQGWLYKVARNLVNGYFRNVYKKKKNEMNVDYRVFDVEDESEHSLEELFDYHGDIEKLCSNVLEKLDADEYELYINYYKNKITVARLSEEYNISNTALTTRVYRLKKKIRMIAKDLLNDLKNF